MAEKISFYDQYIPALPMGAYQIEVSQMLLKDGRQVSPKAWTGSQTFFVEGDFYRMDEDVVMQVYPPDKSSGDFDFLVPFAVLGEAAFPWKRDLRDPKGNRMPWVALFMLKNSEILKEETTPVRDYLLQDAGKELRNRIPNAQEALKKLEEKAYCQTVTIAAKLFWRLLPSISELSYLAHVRSVEDGQDSREVSVLLSNRIPKGGKEGETMRLFLLSLEGIYEEVYKEPDLSRYETVRLLVLNTTEFFTRSDFSESFSDVAGRLQETGGDGEYLRFADWQKGNDAVRPWLKRGYIPIAYHARTGEESYGMIRSPLSCEWNQRTPGSKVFLSADHALLYDDVYGIFDFTYANAFETGRLLAFGEESFRKALERLRKRGRAFTDRVLRYLKYVQTARKEQEETYAEDYFLQFCMEMSGEEDFARIGKAVPVDALKAEPAIRMDNDQASAQEFMDFVKKHRRLLIKVLDPQLEELVKRWEELVCLTGFDYEDLVYDERFLPGESVRFFYVDSLWLESCFDGMISYGMDCRFQAVFQELVKEAVIERAMQDGQSAFPVSGFIIRSTLALHWPNLVVKAQDKDGKELAVRQCRELKEDVMLALFDGIPFRIQLKEPPEGVTMGFRDAKLSGKMLDQYWKDRELGVLDVNAGQAGGIAACLAEDAGEKASPALYGFQLIRRLGELEFEAERAGENYV